VIFEYSQSIFNLLFIFEGIVVGQFPKKNARTEKTAKVKISQGVPCGKNSAEAHSTNYGLSL